MGDLNIGKRLKTARQNRNLTLDELAEVTGVSKPLQHFGKLQQV